MQEVSFSEFQDKDFRRLAGFTEKFYPGREISFVDYLHWEYAMNPEGKAIISIAENKSEIIAQYIVIPRKFSIGDSIIHGSLSVNTLTHEGYRGRNLFPSLVSATFSRCGQMGNLFTIGFPNPVSYPIIRKKALFETAGNLTLLFRPLRPMKIVYKFIAGKREKSGEEIILNLSVARDSFNEVSLLDLETDIELYNEFLSVFNLERQNVTLRYPSFMKWRYNDIPFREYRIFKCMEKGKIAAVLVFRARYIYGLRCGILVDFYSRKSSDSPQSLIKFINLLALQNNLDILLMAVTQHSPEFSIVKKEGYRTLPGALMPQPLTFIVKRHSEECPVEVNDFSKWFLTFGDYDIF